MSLFGRQVYLEVGQPGEEGRRIEGLRVSFRVQMSRGRNPNTCTLEVYNPARLTISAFQGQGAVVRLFAGYDVPRLVFQGEAVAQGVWSQQQGPDRVLHFEGQDGGRAFREARVNVSFSTATTLSQVLAAVSEQLGVPKGVVTVSNDIDFPQGITFRGPARDVLDRLAAAQNSDWFIRDGSLYLISANGDTGETAVRFSAELGNLVGSPAPKADGIEVTGLLEPSVRPGRKIVVQSRDHSGTYVAGDVVFLGDSGFDRPFYVVVTARPV